MPVRKAIANEWLRRIAAGYEAQGALLTGRETDPFRNPVGHAFREAAEILVDELLGGMNASRILAALESIVRIRAVQNFTAAQAVGFVFDLKDVVREQAPDMQFDVAGSRVDHMMLLAFDVYMRCREQTYEIRLNEAKRQMWGDLRPRGRVARKAG